MPFRSRINEKISGVISLQQNLLWAFNMGKRESRITLKGVIFEKFQQPTVPDLGQESNGDVISGRARPLAAGLVMPPFSARAKAFTTSKR
jgi:hypothetical protein